MSIVPTVGRIVEYTLSHWDVVQIYKNRGTAFYGNEVEVGQVYPAMIIRTWGSTPDASVNLKVFLDARDDHWATSRSVSAEPKPGHYQWMEFQKGQASKTEMLMGELLERIRQIEERVNAMTLPPLGPPAIGSDDNRD